MAITPWASAFPTNWHESRDVGATYNPAQAAATTSSQVAVSALGYQRFRQQITIPSGVGGTWNATVSGDIWDPGPNQGPAHLIYDGVDQGPIGVATDGPSMYGPVTFNLPVAAGAHTVELWIGPRSTSGQGSLTVPTVTFDFDLVTGGGFGDVPCGCCDAGTLRRCATIDGVSQDVYSCRRPSGVVEWYDVNGNLIPTGQVGPCEPLTPFVITQLTMAERALGDDNTLPGERICDSVPPVSSFTGYTAAAGPCYDGSSANNDTLTWDGPLSSVSMSYQSGGNPGAGAALLTFTSPATGIVTWPANGTPMLPGEVRWSNTFTGGGRATITYLAPAGSPAAGAPRHDGGNEIRIGPPFVTAFTPYHFRIDFYNA